MDLVFSLFSLYLSFHCWTQDRPDLMTSDIHLGDILSRTNIGRKGTMREWRLFVVPSIGKVHTNLHFFQTCFSFVFPRSAVWAVSAQEETERGETQEENETYKDGVRGPDWNSCTFGYFIRRTSQRHQLSARHAINSPAKHKGGVSLAPCSCQKYSFMCLI